MPVTLQVSKRLRSADTSYAADCADGVSPIKSSTIMADASLAGGSTAAAAQPRQLSSSAQYAKRLKYSPPIPCTVRMLLDAKVVQRAGRCRVRFPTFAGWQRQYHKVRIVGRVLSVVEGHAGGGKQLLFDENDDDDGNTSSDEDPRQARKKKGRRQGKDRCGGGRERPFTTLVVCDSTGMIEVRVVHPALMPTPPNEHSLALPSWEAVMSGQHSLLPTSRRRGGGAPSLSSSSWQLAIVAGDYVSCTAAIRLRPVFEVSRGAHEQMLPSSTVTQSAPPSIPFSSTTPYSSSEHYDSPRINDEAPPHSCVSHLIIHAQPTDAFTAEEDASLLSDESGRRQCLMYHRTSSSSSSVSTQQGGHNNDTAFFSSSACRVVQDVNEVTFHALSVLDCMLRTKQQVSSAAQPAAINDHLLGPPLDSFQQVVWFPDHAAAPNHNVVTAAPDVPSLPDNNDEGVAYRQPPPQNAEIPPSSATACVSDTAPPSIVFDPTLLITFSETNHHTSAVFRPPPSLLSLLPAAAAAAAAAAASPTSSSASKSGKGLSRGGQQLSSSSVSTRQQHPPLTTPEAVVHHGGTSPPDRANDPVRNVLLSHRLRVSGGTRQVLCDRHNVSSNSPWPDDEIPDNAMFRTNQQQVDGITKYKTHTTMMRVPSTSGNNTIDFFGEDAGCRPLPSSPAARRPPPSPPMAAEKNSPPWVMSEYHHGTPTHLKPLVQIDSPELPSTAMNRSAQVFYDPSVAAASAGHHPHLQYQQQPMARGVATADFFHSKEEFLSADLHSESVMRMSHHHHRRAGLHTGPLRPHLQQPTMPIEHPLSFPTQQQQQFHWGGGGSGGAHEMPRRPPPGFNGHHLLPQQPHHHHHHYRAHHQLFVPQHHQHHPHSHHPQHQQYMPALPQQQQQMIYHHDRGAPSYDHNRWHQHHVQQHPFPSQSYHPQHYRHGLCDSIPPNQLPRFNNLSGQSSIGFRTFQQ